MPSESSCCSCVFPSVFLCQCPHPSGQGSVITARRVLPIGRTLEIMGKKSFAHIWHSGSERGYPFPAILSNDFRVSTLQYQSSSNERHVVTVWEDLLDLGCGGNLNTVCFFIFINLANVMPLFARRLVFRSIIGHPSNSSSSCSFWSRSLHVVSDCNTQQDALFSFGARVQVLEG